MIHIYAIGAAAALAWLLTDGKKGDTESAQPIPVPETKESENAASESEPNSNGSDRSGDRGGDCPESVGARPEHEHERDASLTEAGDPGEGDKDSGVETPDPSNESQDNGPDE